MTRKNWTKFYTEVWEVGKKYKADVKDWSSLCWGIQGAIISQNVKEQVYTINFQDVGRGSDERGTPKTLAE